MAERTLRKSVRNLALALLNATLVLAALCLWFAWNTMSAAERVSSQLRQAAETVLPLREKVSGLTDGIEALHTEIASLRARGGAAGENVTALELRLAGVEAQLEGITEAVTALRPDPDILINRAVTAAFASLADRVILLLGSFRSQPEPSEGC